MNTHQRRIAERDLLAIGLGCMNLSHAYGRPPPAMDAARLLLRAFDLGLRHFDTAALYGFGRNEELVGQTLAPHRRSIFLASKCGMTGVDGKRVIDGRPSTLKATCEYSLARLRTDHIDLYYLHRWDKTVPIEESVGALADLVRDGKIGAIGLSEVSAATLRKAHRVHPIAAVQSEYSIFTRNPEIAVLDACDELGVAFVAFSPLSRAMLADAVSGDYAPDDIRRAMPRFNPPHLAHNREVAAKIAGIARDCRMTPAQLALAWLLSRHPCIHVVPGTTSIAHLEENAAADKFAWTAAISEAIEAALCEAPIHGPRYGEAAQKEIDTEEFGSAQL